MVGDLGFVGSVEEDVRGLDVSMGCRGACGVNVLDAIGSSEGNGGSSFPVERGAAGSSVTCHRLEERDED